MTSPLAISGDYADFKLIKTRSVVQLIVEIPIEDGERAVSMFGIPQPGNPIKVALARLEKPKTIEHKPDKERRPWGQLSAAQQAGIRCGETAFLDFLDSRKGLDWPLAASVHGRNSEAAAHLVRLFCGVTSRADLDTNPEAKTKWADLEASYQAWLLVAA